MRHFPKKRGSAKNARGGSAGFSLLELLIYVAILSFAMIVVSGMLYTLVATSGSVRARTEIASNLRFASERIIRDLRAARTVSVPAPANATSTSLSLAYAAATTTVNYCVTGDALRRAVNAACASSSPAVTADNVKVSQIVFRRIENFNPSLGKTLVSVETLLSLSFASSTPGAAYSDANQFSITLY